MKKRRNEIKKSDIFSHWVNIDYLPRWGVLLLDLLIAMIAFVISAFIGENVVGYDFTTKLPIWEQAAILLVVQCIFFWVFHTYSGILRYSTFIDTMKAALSVGATGTILVVVNKIIEYAVPNQNAPFLTTVLLIYIFVGVTLLFCWRVIIKTVFEYISHHGQGVQAVLIYGTKSAGLSIAKMLQSNMESSYRPVGFISDFKDNTHHHLLGLKVYPINAELISMMKEKNINSIIISPLKMKELNPLKDLSIFMENNIRILTTPYFTDYSPKNENAAQKIGRIESIQVEDLLERPAIKINTNNVEAILANQVVLVTGGAGYIGSHTCVELIEAGHVFVTHTDSETILHGYEEWGTELVHRLRGMYAFVIWNREEKTMFGARDMFGIKPMYYAEVDGQTYFASEKKSILKLTGNKEIDKEIYNCNLCKDMVEKFPNSKTVSIGKNSENNWL